MSALEWAGIIASPSLGLAGVIGGRWAERRKERSAVTKLDADAAKTLAQAAAILVAPLRDEITELRDRVDRLEAENERLRELLALHVPHLTLSWEL